MGLFNGIFSSKKQTKKKKKIFINWLPLTSLEQIEEIKKESKTSNILVFKHSTRCVISRMVIKQFEELFNEQNQQLKVYYLDLLNYRNVSDELGYVFSGHASITSIISH